MEREDEYLSYETITKKTQDHKLTAHEFLDNSYNYSFDFQKMLKHKATRVSPHMSNPSL